MECDELSLDEQLKQIEAEGRGDLLRWYPNL